MEQVIDMESGNGGTAERECFKGAVNMVPLERRCNCGTIAGANPGYAIFAWLYGSDMFIKEPLIPSAVLPAALLLVSARMSP
jgi:hypothetical protein